MYKVSLAQARGVAERGGEGRGREGFTHKASSDLPPPLPSPP